MMDSIRRRNLDYVPTGAFYFANSGDESNSIMSYIDLNSDFGQFDRDNMARYLTVGYINQANTILASDLCEPARRQRRGRADRRRCQRGRRPWLRTAR